MKMYEMLDQIPLQIREDGNTYLDYMRKHRPNHLQKIVELLILNNMDTERYLASVNLGADMALLPILRYGIPDDLPEVYGEKTGFTYRRGIRVRMTITETLPCTATSIPRSHLIRLASWGLSRMSWCGLLRSPAWFAEREEGDLCQKCHVNKWTYDIPGREDMDPPPVESLGGRPALVPTETITLRIPTPIMDIIRRRAEDSEMTPTIWLVERVIRNEVVRKHRKLEDRSIREEVRLEKGE